MLVYARVSMKVLLVVTYYIMSLSSKFYKDLSFGWGDIQLFVTPYDLELKSVGALHPESKKN